MMPKPRASRTNPLSGIVNSSSVSSFTPSPQQEAAAEWVRDGEGSAFIEAVAGSGKTSTLVHLCPLMSPSSVVFTAFNKKIADEIAQRTKSMRHVHAATFHSIGFQAWRSVAPHVQVDARLKGRDMVEELGVPFPYRAAVKKLVSIGKQCLVDVPGQWNRDNETGWRDLIDHYAITLDVDMDPKAGREDEEKVVARLIEYAAEGVEWARDVGRGLIDFDDMLWLPLLERVALKTYDWVLVDEAQDTNLARRMFAERMARPDSRLVFVGDRNQAIYGFSGASSNAIDEIVHRFDCTRLPLSTTYRCSKAATALARTWVPHIEAHPDNAEGEVVHVPLHRFLVDIVPTLTPADAVLCRNNKPLVSLAFHLIREGVACHVEGREIGNQLGRLASRWKVDTVEELGARLEEYRRRETEKYIARDAEHLIEGMADRVETLFALMGGLDTVDELQERIATMFQDTEGGQRRTVTLSSVHKSKGREWDRVAILGYGYYMPSKRAKQDWEREQEKNLCYVAVTRTKGDLVLVGIAGKEEEL